MNKTEIVNCEHIAMDIPTLAKSLGCGRHTAETIAKEANAKFYIGKRALVNIEKVKEYIGKLTE